MITGEPLSETIIRERRSGVGSLLPRLDLAELYGVTTSHLDKAVRRNRERFPDDFMFQLNNQEFTELIFQIGIAKKGRGGRRWPPCCFTEMGLAMLSSVLGSKPASAVNIEVMRTFTRLRRLSRS